MATGSAPAVSFAAQLRAEVAGTAMGAAPAMPAPVGADPASPSPSQAVPVLSDVPLGRVPIEIGLRSLEGVNHFRIQLSPDDLGRVDVRLDIASDGQVKAHLIVDRPDTLSLLSRDRVQLEQAFQQAGLRASDDGLAFSLRDGALNSGGGRGQSGPDDQPRPQANRPDLPDAPALTGRPQSRDTANSWASRRASGIDLRI